MICSFLIFFDFDPYIYPGSLVGSPRVSWWRSSQEKCRSAAQKKPSNHPEVHVKFSLIFPSPFIFRLRAVDCVIKSRYYQHSALGLVVIVCMLKLVPSNLFSQYKVEGRTTEKAVAAGAFLYLLQETRTASLSAAFSRGRRTRCRFRSLRKDAGEVEKRDPKGLPQVPFD